MQCYFLAFRIIQFTSKSSNTAPTTDVIILPIMLVVEKPSNPKTNPPNSPPITPIIKLTSMPEPVPFTIKLAIHPASKPISIYHNQLIIIVFIVNNLILC